MCLAREARENKGEGAGKTKTREPAERTLPYELLRSMSEGGKTAGNSQKHVRKVIRRE
jgi:hypothetical protein